MPLAELRCSFCNQSQRDVRKLIAGPRVQICDECVRICFDIVAEKKPLASEAASVVLEPPIVPRDHIGYLDDAPPGLRAECSLCRLPAPLEHILLVRGRGGLCRGCVDAIAAASSSSRPHR